MFEILHGESTVFMKSYHSKCLLHRSASSSPVATYNEVVNVKMFALIS